MRKNARGLGREKAPSFPDYARPIFPVDLVFATPLLSEILAQATARVFDCNYFVWRTKRQGKLSVEGVY